MKDVAVPKYESHAFSLVEILIVLTLVIILTMLSTAYLQDFYRQQYSSAKKTQVLTMLNYARNTAVATHRSTMVCISQDNMNCTLQVKENLISFMFDTSQILQIVKIDPGELHFRSFPKSRVGLVFNPIGSADNGTFWYCIKQKCLWALIINKMGRIRSASAKELANLSC